MPSTVRKPEPSTAPVPGKWYNLTLGSSFRDPSSPGYYALRYEFKPASVDECPTGSLHKSKENKVSVEFHNNQQGKSKLTFEGCCEENRENDAVLILDGGTFRLEQLQRSMKQLKHVRQPGESSSPPVGGSPTLRMESSSPIERGEKLQPSTKGTPCHPMQVEVERIEVNTLPMHIDVERINVGNLKGDDSGSEVETITDNSDHPNSKARETNDHDIEGALDVVSDDTNTGDRHGTIGRELTTNIRSIFPDQGEEVSDVDVNDDELDNGYNAAEALRAQVNAEQGGKHSSSEESSGSEGSSVSESSESTSESSSSDSESDGADSVKSI